MDFPAISSYLLFHFFFFFNDTATTEIYTLSLHDALPICLHAHQVEHSRRRIELNAGQMLLGEQAFQAHPGLLEELTGGHAVTCGGANARAVERPQITIESVPAPQEFLPPRVIHQARASPPGSQTEVGVVDSQN